MCVHVHTHTHARAHKHSPNWMWSRLSPREVAGEEKLRWHGFHDLEQVPPASPGPRCVERVDL